MEQEIKIQADIKSAETCQFTVDRPVYPGRSMYFANKERAKGSPLIEKLFEIENVVGILISNTVVKVTKSGHEPWMPIAKQIGSIIRTQLQSGISPISDSVINEMPTEDELREKVYRIFQEEINPAVANHGGYVELIDVKNNRMFLRFGGGCHGCGMATVTLREGIERIIRRAIPEIGDIIDVTDHESGENPYYKSQGSQE